jgi:hypothetical protein
MKIVCAVTQPASGKTKRSLYCIYQLLKTILQL